MFASTSCPSGSYRTSRPENVDALVVHRWAMARADKELNADDEEGIRELKALKCKLSGAGGAPL